MLDGLPLTSGVRFGQVYTDFKGVEGSEPITKEDITFGRIRPDKLADEKGCDIHTVPACCTHVCIIENALC